MITTDIPSCLFVSFFERNIRVLFNWDRFREEGLRVTLSVIEDKGELSGWYVPWYVGENKEEVNYSEPNAQPLALSEIPGNLSFLNKTRRELILSLSESYRVSRQPLQMFAPVYALGKDQFLILDGSHRMSALMISDVSFKLMAFTVFGPMDSRVLPDLRHWIKSSIISSKREA
jgi:hypothetical protein